MYLRDQKPLPAAALRKCLVGMTPVEWYALINSKVFFWFDVDRLNRQRGACEPRPQVVLEVDAMRLCGSPRAIGLRCRGSTRETRAAGRQRVDDPHSCPTGRGRNLDGPARAGASAFSRNGQTILQLN